jgi:hypothetical protein
MIAIMSMDGPRSRGTIIGWQTSGPLLREVEHFARCPVCGGYVDMRDLVWSEDHQGPLPEFWKTTWGTE